MINYKMLLLTYSFSFRGSTKSNVDIIEINSVLEDMDADIFSE